MTVKNIISNHKKNDDDFVFIRMDTLIERLKKMRALNSTPSRIGITQYTWKSCAIDRNNLSKNR